MRKYEVMYIMRPNLESDAVKELVAKFEGVVTSFGGEITKTDEKGKRRLAYEIDDLFEGYYVLMNFMSNAAAVAELERVLKISEDVIRYLIVKDEK